MMDQGQGGFRVAGFLTLASITLVAAILYFAKAVLMPLAVAILIAFLLSPLVTRLMRFGLPKALAVVTTVGLGFAVFGVIGWLVTSQLISLTQQLPKYEDNLRAKIASLKAPSQGGSFSRAAQVLKNLKKDIDRPVDKPITADAPLAEEEAPVPVAVELKKTEPSFQILKSFFGPLLGPLATAGIVIVLVIAMLFQREDLRERFMKVVSGGQLNIATQAVDDGARRISRYLLMNLLVNTTYGIPIGVGLYFIGVPNAILWGLLAVLLRFIPYLGPWIAAAFPIALSIAVDPGWTKLFLTLALFGVIELISNNLVEPWLYGQSTGTSNVALIIAALFWTWLWGVMGLFLATPLTVCLAVMGKHIPGLAFLSDLLSSEPALPPPAQFYQRMLAMDHDEMLTLAREFLKQRSLDEFYDEVAIPALIMAERDRHSGTLAEIRQQFIFQTMRELVEELGEIDAKAGLGATGHVAVDSILCIPAKDDADEITALMFAQVLSKDGIGTKVVSITEASADECAQWATPSLKAVCISALPPGAVSPARQVCRRLSSRFGGLKIFAGFWGHTSSPIELEARFSHACPSRVVTSLRDARNSIKLLLEEPISQPMAPAPIPPEESKRLEELRRLDLLDTEPEELFDSVTRELAKVFGVPISLVSLIDSDRQFWKSEQGLPPELAEARESARDTSMCGHVVAANEVMVVEDIQADPRFANNPFLKERGIRFYAGAPLRTASGYAVGSLCVIDTRPRQISEADKLLLVTLADKLMRQVESRNASDALAHAH